MPDSSVFRSASCSDIGSVDGSSTGNACAAMRYVAGRARFLPTFVTGASFCLSAQGHSQGGDPEKRWSLVDGLCEPSDSKRLPLNGRGELEHQRERYRSGEREVQTREGAC